MLPKSPFSLPQAQGEHEVLVAFIEGHLISSHTALSVWLTQAIGMGVLGDAVEKEEMEKSGELVLTYGSCCSSSMPGLWVPFNRPIRLCLILYIILIF